MPWILLLIPLFEILGLFGFIYLAALLGSHGARYLPLVLAVFPVVWIAIKNGKKLTSKQIVVASILASILFVSCFQILGFVFPGLAKDVDVFSVANLTRLSVIAVVAAVGHVGLFAVARYIRW